MDHAEQTAEALEVGLPASHIIFSVIFSFHLDKSCYIFDIVYASVIIGMVNTGKAKIVILIDDDQLIHAVFELFLRNSNCKLISILDIKKAFEYAENPELFNKPDLLFVDFRIGAKLGTDLIKQMRLQKYFDNIPIVLFTGYDCEHEDLSSLRLADILQKPCSKEDVLACISKEYQT